MAIRPKPDLIDPWRPQPALADAFWTMKKHGTNLISVTERIDLNTSLGHVLFVLISALAQLERDLISERVRAGLINARAKGVRIGRERKRNQALIESLLDAGLSYREIARISKTSHGSVHAAKKEYLAKKAAAEKLRQVELEKPIEFANPEVAPPLENEVCTSPTSVLQASQ